MKSSRRNDYKWKSTWVSCVEILLGISPREVHISCLLSDLNVKYSHTRRPTKTNNTEHFHRSSGRTSRPSTSAAAPSHAVVISQYPTQRSCNKLSTPTVKRTQINSAAVQRSTVISVSIYATFLPLLPTDERDQDDAMQRPASLHPLSFDTRLRAAGPTVCLCAAARHRSHSRPALAPPRSHLISTDSE